MLRELPIEIQMTLDHKNRTKPRTSMMCKRLGDNLPARFYSMEG